MPAGKTVLNISLPRLMIKDRVLAQNIHLEIAGAKKVCIIGNNGVGKTTLIKCIAEKLLERTDIRAVYMPQNYEDLEAFKPSSDDYAGELFDREWR